MRVPIVPAYSGDARMGDAVARGYASGDAQALLDFGIRLGWVEQPGCGRPGRSSNRWLMGSFRAQFPGFESHVRAVFAEQSFMRRIGAEMGSVSPGQAEIVLPFRDDLLQHHGYVHGAVIAAIVDTACGCSALTLMPAGSTVLTVEYKINFMAPAAGERLVARGRVVRPGRKLTVCSGEAVAIVDGNEKPVAALMATMVRVPPAGESEQ